jgi:glutamate/tyrosine decarboxylase-like PLP-dependent enzyme
MAAAVMALDGVVAFMCARPDGNTYVQEALLEQLRALGARVAARLGRDVTHVVFQPRLCPSAEEKKAEDTELRAVYERIDKARARPAAVPTLPLRN